MIPLIAALVTPAHGGAWTKEVGDAYVKGGADVYQALRYVVPGAAEPVDGGTFFGQQYGVYAEVGVLPPWRGQIAIAAPLTVGTATGTAQDAFGDLELKATSVRMGDLRLLPQIALHKTAPVAAMLEIKIPLYRNGSIGGSSPVFMDFFPIPGDGQLDVTAWLLGGAAPSGATFFEGGLGYRRRTEAFFGWDTTIEFVDGLTFTGTGGVRGGPVLVMLKADGVVSVATDDVTRQFVTAGPALLVDLASGVAIEARFAGELWARNASQGIGGGLGVSWRTP